MSNINKLEEAVIRKLLIFSVERYGCLIKQIDQLIVENRKVNDAGFSTYFLLSDTSKICSEIGSLRIGNVVASIPSLNRGAGFLLFIKNGAIKSLEGYPFAEDWPTEIHEFELNYSDVFT